MFISCKFAILGKIKSATSPTYLSSCKTHFLHESVDRTLIMIRFNFPLHTLSTPEFRPRTLRDTARFILVVNNMSCAIFRSEKLELLLHTSV